MDTIHSGVEADLQEVLEHLSLGKPLNPDLKRRVRERAEEIRKQILATYGVQDIGVGLIRELRGDLPGA
jgi:hypothetical protein